MPFHRLGIVVVTGAVTEGARSDDFTAFGKHFTERVLCSSAQIVHNHCASICKFVSRSTKESLIGVRRILRLSDFARKPDIRAKTESHRYLAVALQF
jgi:hypothetical protein